MRRALSWIGLELTPNHHREKLISGVGGFVGILIVICVTHFLAGPDAVMPVLASMGASAVLLFAVPHGPLSQPWPFAAGHLLSAIIGVACARYIPNPAIAGALAAGAAITAMYYARCIHPPGGATALTAVLGGPALRHLGWTYVLTPVAANVAVLLAAAVAFNYCCPWRRYPATLAAVKKPTKGALDKEDWSHALRQVGSLADVSEEELAELHTLALRHFEQRQAARTPRPPHRWTRLRRRLQNA